VERYLNVVFEKLRGSCEAKFGYKGRMAERDL